VVVFGLSFDNSTERPLLWWRNDRITKGAVGCNQPRGEWCGKERQNGHKIHIFNKKNILWVQHILLSESGGKTQYINVDKFVDYQHTDKITQTYT
jgi:hypothetical protein